VLLLMLTAAVIYYVAPNVDQPFRFITPGAALTVIIWIIASLGFSLYVANFANYSATYGTLGGVVVLLFYFFNLRVRAAPGRRDQRRGPLRQGGPSGTEGGRDVRIIDRGASSIA